MYAKFLEQKRHKIDGQYKLVTKILLFDFFPELYASHIQLLYFYPHLPTSYPNENNAVA